MATINARYCLRDYNGPNVNAKFPKYYTNVIDYSSNPSLYSYGAISYAAVHLLGNPQAPIAAHQTPVVSSSCITAAEQNQYVDVIYNDVSLLLGKQKGLIRCKLDVENFTVNTIPHTKWLYRQIKIGTNGYYPNYSIPLNVSQII